MIKDHLENKTIFFGSYPQGANGEVKPIEWIILKEKEDSMFLVSKYALDCKKYHDVDSKTKSNSKLRNAVKMTWENCDLRAWLNNEFLNTAFTANEKKQIRTVTLRNAGNSYFMGLSGGNNTSDKVYVLSYSEAMNYLKDTPFLSCFVTDYAIANGCLDIRDKPGYKDGLCYTYWLRTVGCQSNRACVVERDMRGGFEISHMGNEVWWPSIGIRPAIRIFKNSDKESTGECKRFLTEEK